MRRDLLTSSAMVTAPLKPPLKPVIVISESVNTTHPLTAAMYSAICEEMQNQLAGALQIPVKYLKSKDQPLDHRNFFPARR